MGPSFMAFSSSLFSFKMIKGMPNINRAKKMRMMKTPVSMMVSYSSKTYSAVDSNNRNQSKIFATKKKAATEANARSVSISRKANCSKLATITRIVRDRFSISTQFHNDYRYSNPLESLICLISFVMRKHQIEMVGMHKRTFSQT